LANDFDTDGDLVMVVGFNAPRDPAEMLAALKASRASTLVCTQPDWARRIPADVVAEAATTLGIANVVWEPDIGRAVDRARDLAGETGTVLVTGSLYVVGPARTHLGL
jgi:dihydrofolate synthase / folylpolyglutamate synthase